MWSLLVLFVLKVDMSLLYLVFKCVFILGISVIWYFVLFCYYEIEVKF